ncbi:tyrosine-type recombinase/integrase [Microbacterium sp. SL75]|uniref:tyrosine-type recombinase/integrase n=1 Tax=Microbacterium sp. SL75 TaxID=2995140 RepID=UPI00226F5553|nr:tyrosine-type recombinase/integrase [Microbacterium sp. SL75]WAC68866.1 tyrosine-type recombinase/integrase [Microbacterium sp. SL75]
MAWSQKLPSGRYRGAYRLPSGEVRYTRGGTFTSKRAAKDAATELEVKVKRPGWRDPRASEITWGDWLEMWSPGRQIEPSTVENEAGMIEQHLLPQWRDAPLAGITRHDVQTWATRMVKENLGTEEEPRYRKSSSVRRYLNVFVSSMTAAIDAELIDTNPATRIKLPPDAAGDPVFLTREQYAALSAAVPNSQDRALLDFLVGTGLRWGEAAGLHLHRLDLTRGVVTVADVTDGREIKPYPKGRRQRHVPLLQWSVDYLEVPAARDCGVQHRAGRCPSGLVFPAARGGIRDDRNFYRRVMQPALKAAGLDHMGATLHDLRHTYASWLAQDGVPLGRIAELLGHRSITTTEIYAHFATATAADIAFAMRDPREANVKQKPAVSGIIPLRRATQE